MGKHILLIDFTDLIFWIQVHLGSLSKVVKLAKKLKTKHASIIGLYLHYQELLNIMWTEHICFEFTAVEYQSFILWY